MCNCETETHGSKYAFCGIDPYSTDIAAAWEVVNRFPIEPIESNPGELLSAEPWNPTATITIKRAPSSLLPIEIQWYVEITTEEPKYKRFVSMANTAPHAISLAALKAVDVKVEA